MAGGAGRRVLQAALASESRVPAPAAAEIDLHFLRVPDALRLVREVLDHHRQARRAAKGRYPLKFVTFITGRGAHSPGNLPRIKPAVESFLEARRYEFIPLQAGCLRVTIPDS